MSIVRDFRTGQKRKPPAFFVGDLVLSEGIEFTIAYVALNLGDSEWVYHLHGLEDQPQKESTLTLIQRVSDDPIDDLLPKYWPGDRVSINGKSGTVISIGIDDLDFDWDIEVEFDNGNSDYFSQKQI